MVKNPLANAGYIRDKGSIPKSGRAPGEGMATHSSILDWRIPWTEDLGQATVHGVTKSWTRLSDSHSLTHITADKTKLAN